MHHVYGVVYRQKHVSLRGLFCDCFAIVSGAWLGFWGKILRVQKGRALYRKTEIKRKVYEQRAWKQSETAVRWDDHQPTAGRERKRCISHDGWYKLSTRYLAVA